MIIKQNYLYLSVFSLLIAFSFFFSAKEKLIVFADDNDILSFVAYGAFNNGVNLTNLSEPQNFSQTVYWDYIESRDYIYFRDSTTVPGFRIQLYMSSSDVGNFVYTGESVSQGSIDKSNFKIMGDYYSSTPYPPSFGVDDSTATLNINSARSCPDAQNWYRYVFNDDLKNSSKNYSLAMSSSSQDYLNSGVACGVEGQIDIRRMELTYPPSTTDGVYESQLMIIIIDGGEGEAV